METLKLYAQPKIIAIFFLGFSSGLPRALPAWTLTIWLAKSGIDIASIGLFAAVSIPYSLKFLWSPLIDGIPFPLLSHRFGRRRGWLIATQLSLIVAIFLLAVSSPADHLWFTALAALLLAFCSASQDIVIDATRVEILSPEIQGAGAAAIVLGYRFGMIASGAGLLYLVAPLGWTGAYECMAALMGIGIITAFLIREPEQNREILLEETQKISVVEWLRRYVVMPFADFMTHEHWLLIMLFIVLYKLGDAFMGGMTGPFLVQTGFKEADIASIVKLYGVIATIIGSFIGGALVFRLGTYRSLWLCGIIHTLTNLMFVVQARIGADVHFLAFAITLENISGGMGTAAFVAYLSSLTHSRFTATQYALLSSLATFGVTWLSLPAGWFARMLGWEEFFLLAAALAIPGLIILWQLNKRLNYKTNDACATPTP